MGAIESLKADCSIAVHGIVVDPMDYSSGDKSDKCSIQCRGFGEN